MIQSGLEAYQAGYLRYLENREEMCEVRLIFRCFLCDEDYVSKEGLWNHMDLHAIANESKELHYKEITAKHKLNLCVLCNDHRVYSESSFWKHVHDIHDGFFLRCSDCGENFRSEQHKNDHASSRCKARDRTIAPNEVENMTSDAEHLKLSLKEQISCDICGISFASKGFLLRHKNAKYPCLERMKQKCPHCRKKFHIEEYQTHFSLCEKKKFSCGLCPMKFLTSTCLSSHKRNVHCRKEVLRSEQKDPNPTNNMMEQTMNSTVKPTGRSDNEIIDFSPDSSCSSNAVEDRDSSMAEKDITDKSVPLLVEKPSSESSGTKCIHCGKECASATNLRHHIVNTHQLTKCSICGITFEGLSKARHHKGLCEYYKITNNIQQKTQHGLRLIGKIKCQKEPKYECRTCGKKIRTQKECIAHRSFCEHGVHSSKLREGAFGEVSSVKSHNMPHHLDESCLETIQLDQDQKQAQNSNLKMEITAEETTISARDDQGLPTVDPSSRVNVSNSRPNEHSSANLNDDDSMDCQVIDKESRRVSVAPLDGSNKRHASSEEVSQPLVENLSNEPYLCNICNVTCHSYTHFYYHKMTRHTEGKFQCFHCSRKFHFKHTLDRHAPRCKYLKYSCELCGQKFNLLSKLVNHKEQVHHGNGHLRNASTEGADCTEEQKQNSVEVTCHKETKYACPTCGEKFHCEEEYNAHCLTCEHKTYSCNICGITVQSYSRIHYHMLTKHTEGKFQCPHCSRKFHIKLKMKGHAACCADLKHSCELCGQKFRNLSCVEIHKKVVHHRGSGFLRNANIEDADCTAEQNQHSVEKINAAQEMTRCIICRIVFASTDELMKHKLICPKHTQKHADSQFSAEEMSLLHELKEAQVISTIVPQVEYIDINLEIKVEETMLQEQEYQVPNEDLGRSFASTEIKCQKEPKYECRTCGEKFRTQKECIAHRSSKLREGAFGEVSSVKSHNMPHHLDESCLETIQLDQGQKQAQNSDLKMEITAEETTISARDDQGLSSVDPSSRVNVSNSRPNEHSSANLNDDDSMDCQVIDKESRRVSVAPLHAVSEEVSQPLVENVSNEPYLCDICNVTSHSYTHFYYHKLTRHTEGKFQCFHCSRKFHYKNRLEKHAPRYKFLKYSCELCGQKFNLLSKLVNHKEQIHHGNGHLRNANTEGADCTEEQKQHSVELTCPKHTQKHVDSQFGAEEMSLLHELKEAQVNSTIVPQGEYIDLNLEIKVEETTLQEQ